MIFAKNLDSPITQYFVALIINVAFVIILLSNSTSFHNIQLPEGKYSENLWQNTDVMTYVLPARNFLTNGIFGYGQSPDYNRTIGYPLLLSIFINFCGKGWIYYVIFFQAIIIAFLFPLINKLIGLFFPQNKFLLVSTFLFLTISGLYFSTTPKILTDTFFTLMFTAGFYFSLISVKRRSWKLMILQLIFIGYAAQIRPSLLFYFLANLIILFVFASFVNLSGDMKVRKIILVSTMAIFLFSVLPSVRNYINFSFFKPTTIMDLNYFDGLGKMVLINEGKLEEFVQEYDSITIIEDPFVRADKYREAGFRIYKKYPLTTIYCYTINLSKLLLGNFFNEIGIYWEYYRQELIFANQMSLKRSELLAILTIFWAAIYFIRYIFFVSFLIRSILSNKFHLVIIFLVLIGYFLIPVAIAGGGPRMRMPVESIFVIVSLYEIQIFYNYLKSKLFIS